MGNLEFHHERSASSLSTLAVSHEGFQMPFLIARKPPLVLLWQNGRKGIAALAKELLFLHTHSVHRNQDMAPALLSILGFLML